MCAYEVHDIYNMGSSCVKIRSSEKDGQVSLPLRSNDMKI
jgi:hypothetical protein